MATTVHEPPVGSHDGGGFDGRGPTGSYTSRSGVIEQPHEAARTGIWVGLAGITMMFAAFTSAIIVREGSANDWMHIVLPPVIYFNTLVLILSSFTLEVARRRAGDFMRGVTADKAVPMRWLYLTLALGLIFIVGQFFAWQQLKAQGIYLATNPTSSFFYVLTAVHVIHVLGGLGGLIRVMTKLGAARPVLRRSTFAATSYYWHFMGGLWIYLLAIIWVKL